MQLTAADLKLIQEAIRRNSTAKELEESGILDRLPDRAMRVYLAKIDMEFFVRFYLAHHFDCDPAPLHKETYATALKTMSSTGRQNHAIVWPRGFGKTTTISLAVPLWCIVFLLRRFIVIISDSYPQAKQQLATLKEELENNERIQEDFGQLRGPKWQEDDITTANQIKVIALGARMKIRGRKFRQFRPDLIIVDDSENLEGVQSAARREAHRQWFFRSLMKAGWRGTKVFVVGNFLHFDCLLKHLVDNPMFTSRIYKAVPSFATNQQLWDEWREVLTNLDDPEKARTARQFFLDHEAAMLEGAVSAWPAAIPYYDLMVSKVTDGDAAFATELQNDPIDPEKRLFKRWETFRMEWRDSYAGSALDLDASGMTQGGVWLIPTSGAAAIPLAACAIFGYTDPSMGQTIRADRSACMILAKAPTRQMFLLEADIKIRPPDQIINAQNRLAEQYPITRWGIERNAFQALYATESARRALEAGVDLPVVSINTLRNKALRINSLQPDLENSYLLIREDGQKEIKEELTQWPMGRYDDGLDALEGVRTLAKGWEAQIETEMVQANAHHFGQTPYASTLKPFGVTDPYAKWDELADQTIYELKVAAAIAAGEDPNLIPVPEERFVPVMFL